MELFCRAGGFLPPPDPHTVAILEVFSGVHPFFHSRSKLFPFLPFPKLIEDFQDTHSSHHRRVGFGVFFVSFLHAHLKTAFQARYGAQWAVQPLHGKPILQPSASAQRVASAPLKSFIGELNEFIGYCLKYALYEIGVFSHSIIRRLKRKLGFMGSRK